MGSSLSTAGDGSETAFQEIRDLNYINLQCPNIGNLHDLDEPEEGRIYRMFHGTSKENARLIIKGGRKFERSKDGLLGPGVYVTRDFQKARQYPLGCPDGEKVVFVLRVKVGRVKVIKTKNDPLQKTWSAHGFDSAWIPPNTIEGKLQENCVWSPDRIRITAIGENTEKLGVFSYEEEW